MPAWRPVYEYLQEQGKPGVQNIDPKAVSLIEETYDTGGDPADLIKELGSKGWIAPQAIPGLKEVYKAEKEKVFSNPDALEPISGPPSTAPAEAERTAALEQFQKRIGKTNIDDVTPENLAKLEKRFAETRDRSLLPQIKLAKGIINLKNAPIVDGKLQVDDKYAQQSMDKAKREQTITAKTSDPVLAIFPELSKVIREEGGEEDWIPSVRATMAAIEDLGTSVSSALAAVMDSDSEGDFFQKMALTADERSTGENILNEVGNLINYLPSSKGKLLPEWFGKFTAKTGRGVEKYGKLKSTIGQTIQGDVLQKVGRGTQKLGEKLGSASKKLQAVAQGANQGDIAQSIAITGVPKNIASTVAKEMINPSSGKLKTAMIKTVMDDLPSATQDALFRITSGDSSKQEALVDFLIGLTIGTGINRFKAKTPKGRLQNQTEMLTELEGKAAKDELSSRGLELGGYQIDNVNEALEIVEEAMKREGDELDQILSEFNIDISDILETYGKRTPGAEGIGRKEAANYVLPTGELAAKPNPKGIIDNQIQPGEIRGDVLRQEVSSLGDLAFSEGSEIVHPGAKKAWQVYRDRLIDGIPNEDARIAADQYFNTMEELYSTILSPVKKGKSNDLVVDTKIEGMLKKLRNAVAKPETSVSVSLRPLFDLSSKAKEEVVKQFDEKIAKASSKAQKRALEKQRDQKISKFNFAGNELRILREFVEEFGEKEGLRKFLEQPKRSMLAKTLRAVWDGTKFLSKGPKEGARKNLYESVNYLVEKYNEPEDVGLSSNDSSVSNNTKSKIGEYARSEGWKTQSGINWDNVTDDIKPALNFAKQAAKEAGLESLPEISSLFRDEAKNKAVGGVEGSRHTHGDAIDLSTKGIKGKALLKFKNALKKKAKENGWQLIDNYADGHLHLEME